MDDCTDKNKLMESWFAPRQFKRLCSKYQAVKKRNRKDDTADSLVSGVVLLNGHQNP